MHCCLNPGCHNPEAPDQNKYCPNCGVPLVILRLRYRPLKRLGSGGFGKTYLAEDRDRLNTKCVIKQFAPQIQGTGSLQKATELFEQEAKQLEKLGAHPQIPRLLAYFEDDNRLYLVQEYIEGENLFTELQKRGTFSEAKIRELLLDLLPILEVVHQAKVIHRDIKPENIMRYHDDGKLFLIDFGASKQLKGTVNPGTPIGTFGYVAKEQMVERKAYPASDLYSVGATCFHLLTGINPWSLWDQGGYGWVREWQQHLQKPISQGLGLILDKLLQEDYEQRYQSAGEVLQALTKVAPQHPPPIPSIVVASPPPAPPKGSHPPQPVPPKVSPLPQPIPRQKFLKWVGWGGVGLGIAVVGGEIFKGHNQATPIPKSTNQATPKPTGLPMWTVEFETVTVDETGQIIKRDSSNQAKFFKEDLGNGITLEMVYIPGGSFKMGSPAGEKGRDSSESPQHDVNVPAFFMGRFEVTQEQYQQVMGKNPSNFKGAKRPVEQVSWSDAIAFCNKLSQKTGRKYRLPSEAEWEYACRAGTKTPFYFGETITTELANYNGNYTYAAEPKGKYRQQTTEVGSFPPNAFGLYDMHGNVWEWCQDTYHKSYEGAPDDGSAWVDNDNSYHLLRGGSWGTFPGYCRSAGRYDFNPAYSYFNFGFRVVCVAARTI